MKSICYKFQRLYKDAGPYKLPGFSTADNGSKLNGFVYT